MGWLEKPDADADSIIGENYEADPDEVRSWIEG
jgi:hypothetical protein